VDNLSHKKLYLLVLLSSLAIVVVSLGGGMFQQGGFWMDHWQHKAFRGICHQDPQRSFWLNGTPMAVCTRCFGIYSSFASAWLLFPLVMGQLTKVMNFSKKVLIVALLLNVVDVLGNAVGFWQNTVLIRFTFGSLLGLSAVFVLSREFYKKTITNKGMSYGTTRTE